MNVGLRDMKRAFRKVNNLALIPSKNYLLVFLKIIAALFLVANGITY